MFSRKALLIYTFNELYESHIVLLFETFNFIFYYSLIIWQKCYHVSINMSVKLFIICTAYINCLITYFAQIHIHRKFKNKDRIERKNRKKIITHIFFQFPLSLLLRHRCDIQFLLLWLLWTMLLILPFYIKYIFKNYKLNFWVYSWGLNK